jgi:hypothetical protein
MFVEQISWSVARGLKDDLLGELEVLSHHMDASGGLILPLIGYEVNCPDKLSCLSFWKSWEDLARFLASPGSDLLGQESLKHGVARPKPHHYEVIWQWPQEEVEQARGQSHWVVHEYEADENQIDVLFDNLRHGVPKMLKQRGFCTAGLWLDKRDNGHAAMATQWSHEADVDDSLLDAAVLLSSVQAKAKEISRSVYAMKTVDLHLVGQPGWSRSKGK